MTGDLKKLQGTWTIVSVEAEGRSMPGGSKIILDGERFITVAMGSEYGGTVELDTKAKPKTFDVLFDSGPHKGEKSLGIYELDGDTWRLCLAFAGIKKRPKKFAAPAGSGFALETLKRGDGPLAAAVDTGEEADAGAPTELDGEWTMVSGVWEGFPMEKGLIKVGRRVAKGSALTVYFGPQVYMKARVAIDPSKTPKHIDYAISSGTGAGSAQAGIYELNNGELQLCMATARKPRPTDFASTKGSGRTLTVWKHRMIGLSDTSSAS